MGFPIQLLADASGALQTGLNAACGSGSCNTGSTVQSILASIGNILVFVVGAVAVIMIIVGALRYVTANGDSKAVEQAKNTLLYAVIGLITAGAAYAIVKFVVGHIK